MRCNIKCEYTSELIFRAKRDFFHDTIPLDRETKIVYVLCDEEYDFTVKIVLNDNGVSMPGILHCFDTMPQNVIPHNWIGTLI